MLRDGEKRKWDLMLPHVLPQATLGFSPFELLYGREVRGPLDVLKEEWIQNPETEALICHGSEESNGVGKRSRRTKCQVRTDQAKRVLRLKDKGDGPRGRRQSVTVQHEEHSHQTSRKSELRDRDARPKTDIPCEPLERTTMSSECCYRGRRWNRRIYL